MQYSLSSSSPLLRQISSPLPDMEEIIFDEVEEVTVTVAAGATTASTSILSLPQIPPPSLPPILSPPTPSSPGIVLSPKVIINRRLCNLEDGKPNDNNNSEVNNDSYNLHIENLGTIRSKVYERQITNASKMLQLSSANVTPVSLYDSVNVIIPKEDRENKTGMRTISGIIIEIDNERDLYRVATKFGTINQYLSRNDFDKTIERIMPSEINKNQQLGLREIVRRQSNYFLSDNRHLKQLVCHCKLLSCLNHRCICKRNNQKCTQKCRHNENLCKNS